MMKSLFKKNIGKKNITARKTQKLAAGTGLSIMSAIALGTASPAAAQVGITSLDATYQSGTSSSYSTQVANPCNTGSYPSGCGSNINMQFGVGATNDLKLSGFSVGTQNYSLVQLAERVAFRRINNAAATGERQLVFFEYNTNNQINSSYTNTMAEAMLSTIVNRGIDNAFSNTAGDVASNNIERIDYIISDGLDVPSTALGDIGFLILERNGNDPFKIAAITSLDENGNPKTFGPLQSVATSTWGKVGPQVQTAVMRREENEIAFRPSHLVGSQTISGVYVSISSLGINPGQKIYGYALFPNDISASNDLINLSDFPTTTSGGSGQGGLDLMAGGGIFMLDSLTTISGTLYEDSDGGDDLDPSEPKLPADITVNLLDNSDNVIATTTTNSNGSYTFAGVANGNYKIQVDTTDTDIPSGYTLGTPNDLPVTVSGSPVTDRNFAFDEPIEKIPDPPPTSTDPTPPEGRICAVPGSDGSASLSGAINTYHPGAASVSAGTSSITLGAINPNGNTTPISKGDKLLIIQMQDAEINSTNTDAYGNGSPGSAASGSTALNTAGYYQYVVADNDVPTTGGTLQIKEPLEYTFTNADATASTGQRRFQVVRLPQHSNATISSTVTAAPWNGNSGGVFALDVSKTLTFSGGTIDVSGQGFRGGGGVNVNGNNNPLPAPGNTDYVNLSTQPFHGSKGEGIAGTPRLMRNDVTTTVTDNGIEGYPNGSFGRGAPGNAGGGSTDPNQQNNSANTGGGGGANHGYGGHGGDSWTDTYGRQPMGGFGGQAFPTSFNRIILGGGGGAGTANNSPNGPTPSGGGGGGIVILRAGQITGTGTIEANGIQGVEPEGTDGGGGGGAGGSVMVLSVDPSSASVTINARGGNGLDSGFYEHGPGGGGGGGYVAYQGLTPVTDVSGGESGVDKAGGTANPDADPYGATAGGVGLAEAATIPEAGVKPGAECLSPNVLLVKRITAINSNTTTNGGDDLSGYINEQDDLNKGGNPYDDNVITVPDPPTSETDPQKDTDKWPDPNTFLIGGISGGKVDPNDELEYTIYFLSTGDIEAKTVLVCDRIPSNTTFIPNAFNSFSPQGTGGLATADRGIIWQYNNVTQSLTNAQDGDAGQYFPPGVDPKTVYPNINCGGENTNGAVVVNLGDLPNATAPGVPTNSYGFVRFKGKVK